MKRLILIALLLILLFVLFRSDKKEGFHSSSKSVCQEFMKPAIEWYLKNIKDPYEKGLLTEDQFELAKSKFYDICVWMVAPKMEEGSDEAAESVKAFFDNASLEKLTALSALVRMWWLESVITPENWDEEKFNSTQIKFILLIEKCMPNDDELV